MKIKNLFMIILTTLGFLLNAQAENTLDNQKASLQAAIEDTFTIEEERVLVSAIKENESAQSALNLTISKMTTDIQSGKLTEQNIAFYLNDYLNTLTEMHTPASIIELHKQMANDARERIIKQNTSRHDIFNYFIDNISQMKQPTNPQEKKPIPDSIIVDLSRLMGAYYNSHPLQSRLQNDL